MVTISSEPIMGPCSSLHMLLYFYLPRVLSALLLLSYLETPSLFPEQVQATLSENICCFPAMSRPPSGSRMTSRSTTASSSA